MNEELFFYLSILILAAALYIPVNKLIWVLSVRRIEKKSKSKLNEYQRNLQKNRSRFISILLVFIFSYLFNMQIF